MMLKAVRARANYFEPFRSEFLRYSTEENHEKRTPKSFALILVIYGCAALVTNQTPSREEMRAGTTVKAPVFSITGDGIEYFGAFRPVWRSKTLDQDRDIDLWIVRMDGKNPRLLVRNGFSPSWR